jgi:hypothetical protein
MFAETTLHTMQQNTYRKTRQPKLKAKPFIPEFQLKKKKTSETKDSTFNFVCFVKKLKVPSQHILKHERS